MKNKYHNIPTYNGAFRLAGLSFGLALTMSSASVFADLNAIPGQNGVQSATAAVVQTICPQMGALGGGQGTLPAGQQQLFERCRELVQTSNAQQGAGGTGFALDLDEAELREALQRIAPEEVGAMASGSSDTAFNQVGSVVGRMATIRGSSIANPVAGVQWSLDPTTGGAAGDEGFSKLGLFVSATGGTGEKDRTSEEDGFEYDSYGLTIGMDYRFSDNLVGGIAIDYSSTDVDLDLGYGSSENDNTGATLYGTYYAGSFYIDAVLSFGKQDYDAQRNVAYAGNVNQALVANTDGDSTAFSLGAGYDITSDSWSTSLFGRVQSSSADIDGFTESGGELAMMVGDQSIDSLRAVLGAQVSKTISAGYGVWIPYIGLELHHEFDDEQRAVVSQYVFDPTATSFSFQSDAADENFALGNIGASLVLPHGSQMFFNYERSIGLADVTNNVFSIGIRFEL
ncbi:MAG: autotransporter outer membrane beta-barrel domain-containing protein [Pseudomonadales bacterium]